MTNTNKENLLEAYLSRKSGIKPAEAEILRQFSTAQNALRHHSQLIQALGAEVGQQTWKELLDIRLGYPLADEPPRFLGCANIARARWCHYKVIFRCIEEEYMFKEAYDEDVPVQGVTPTVEDYNRWLSERSRQEKMEVYLDESVTPKGRIFWDWEKGRIAEEGVVDPMARGMIIESHHAERYPSIRFHFEFLDKIVLGIPDGITEEFCYEFKSTRNKFLYRFVLPVARCQANLYAYFLKRPRIRIQIHILESDELKTVEQEADYSQAEADLTKIVELLNGKQKAIAPKPWKCNRCKFAAACPGRRG